MIKKFNLKDLTDLNRYKFYNLSKGMKIYLKKKYADPGFKGVKSTVSALNKRNLVDIGGELNEEGTVVAISLLSLKKQCEILGIEYKELKINCEKQVEFCVMDYYSRDSVKIYFAENIIARSFVQILLLHRQLKSLNENGEKLYNLNLNYLESLSIDDIKSFDDINLEQFKKNFSLCRNYFNNEWGGPFFAGADSLDLLIDLFNALGEEKIKDFIIFMALNNDLVCTGWPDLVVFEKGNYYFIEVKTTDKLHISQIITINKIIKDLGIKVKCIKIKKT